MKKNNDVTIFLVEDNKTFTIALKADIENSFASRNLKIHTFETGEQCMKEFKKEDPQVVILDYNLNSKYPDAANGVQILDQVKKSKYDTSVIMLTSEDDINIALRSFQHGASDYVVKSETKFKKINYSLLNIFKMIEARREARRYKNIVMGLATCVILFIGGLIAIQILAPSLLK